MDWILKISWFLCVEGQHIVRMSCKSWFLQETHPIKWTWTWIGDDISHQQVVAGMNDLRLGTQRVYDMIAVWTKKHVACVSNPQSFFDTQILFGNCLSTDDKCSILMVNKFHFFQHELKKKRDASQQKTWEAHGSTYGVHISFFK